MASNMFADTGQEYQVTNAASSLCSLPCAFRDLILFIQIVLYRNQCLKQNAERSFPLCLNQTRLNYLCMMAIERRSFLTLIDDTLVICLPK